MKTIKTICLAASLAVSGSCLSHAQVILSDSFSTAHDYSSGNVAGTIWTGVLNAGNATSFNADTDVANQLNIAVSGSANTGYDGSHSSAPFLYVAATGDFTATLHYTGGSTNPYSSPSVMAYGDSSNFLSTTFLASTPQTALREVIGGSQTDISSAAGSYYMLSRSGETYTSEVSSNGTSWTTIGSYTATTGSLFASTVDVGLAFGNYGGSGTSNGQFSNFTIDLKAAPEPTTWALFALGALVLGIKARRFRSSII